MLHTKFGDSISKSATELETLGLPYINYSQVGYYEAIGLTQDKCGGNWHVIGEIGHNETDLPTGSIRIGQVRVHPSDSDYAIIVIPTSKWQEFIQNGLRRTCARCGYQWQQRGKTTPKWCPHCNSPYWNKPRQQGD